MAAGSTSTEEYTIKFNVDVLAPGVRHADSEVQRERERKRERKRERERERDV